MSDYEISLDNLNTTKIYFPIIFKGRSSDNLQVSHTFTLYDENGDVIQRITSPNNEFKFIYQNFDEMTIGTERSFSIGGDCQRLSRPIQDANINFVVTNATISESILYVYNQLKDILDDIGIMTDDAEGLMSLVDLIGEDI